MSAAPPCVVVTRPQPQADEWVIQLLALGLNAGALPLLGIAAPADAALVRAAWQQLAQHALVMFVSPSAVERFFALRPVGLAWPPLAIAAGTGPGTRRALLQAGVPELAVLTPPEAKGQFDSEALWVLLRERLVWPGRSALIVRGDGGRDWLAEALRREGARVHFVQAYRRTAPVLDAAGRALLSQALADPARHCWLFSSREALGHLPALAPDRSWRDARALATHERIVEAARALGFGSVQQVAPTPEAVAELLRRT
jgi:uroporphyrinogen-III synthase